MAIEKILMPKLGESVTEGTIEKWLVKLGDTIEKYEPLAEVNTAKVNAEIPSLFSGTIKEIIAKEGQTLAVGEVVCVIETADVKDDGPEIVDDYTSAEPLSEKVRDIFASGRFSPAVLRLSQEHNIDLSDVIGTGRGGRITRKDVLAMISSEQKEQTTRAHVEKSERPSFPVLKGDVEIPITGLRRTIANNLVRSATEIPHAWMMIEVDVTGLVSYRNAVKEEFKETEGYSLTYFAFFIKAITQALKEFPMMNATWAEDKIIQKKDINISIAVAKEDTLFVPVIKNADGLTIKGIAGEIQTLAAKARSGELQTNDMQGGTFTVNSTGSFGSIQSVGIINYPQAAILQVESIVKRPVVMGDNMIAIRDMVNLCLSIDHRVLDGLISGNFMARVKEILENISSETTSIY